MAWNTRTNLRSVETITQRVVELCHQMEGWRRLLRHVERIERERDSTSLPLFSPSRRLHQAQPAAPEARSDASHSPGVSSRLLLGTDRQIAPDLRRVP